MAALEGFVEHLYCAANGRSHLDYYCSRTQQETFDEDRLPRLFWEGVVCTLHHFPLMSFFGACPRQQPLQLADRRKTNRTRLENEPQADNKDLKGRGAAAEVHVVRSAGEAQLDKLGDAQGPRVGHKHHKEACQEVHHLGPQKLE